MDRDWYTSVSASELLVVNKHTPPSHISCNILGIYPEFCASVALPVWCLENNLRFHILRTAATRLRSFDMKHLEE